MTVIIEDPLIVSMAIARPLPLHESSRRLRELYPESPRVHGVAVMADVSRRRWWPLAAAADGGERAGERAGERDRLRAMFGAAVSDVNTPATAAWQLASTFAHTVVGRAVALLLLEGRAWDPGLENLWVHTDPEGGIDWAGVTDPTLRVLADDPCADADAVVRLPGEQALAIWTSHRCHLTLDPLFRRIHDVSDGALAVSAMWGIVGSAVVATAAHLPLLARCSEVTTMRRAQAVLDAFVGFGLPVRGTRPAKGLLY